MDSKKSPLAQSPVGSPGQEQTAKSPVSSPEKDRASKSPVGSPRKEGSKSPEQRTPSPAQENIVPGTYWTDATLDAEETDDPGIEHVASSTASLSSSILHYREVQGRTYHSNNRGNSEYWGPNDDKQLDSMDLSHHAHTRVLGNDRLFLAPLKDDIQKAVDIGTGTGLWAIDFADAYPNCEVIGTDLSPIQPTWTPPNLKFEIDDATQEWTFEPNSLDFVHMRMLTGCIQDWPALWREAYRCLKPGGWIQSQESQARIDSDDDTIPEKSAMAQWEKLFVSGGKIMNRTFTMIDDGLQRPEIEKAGFVNVNETNLKVPLGSWPKDPLLKEVGTCAGFAISRDVEGYVTYMADMQGWSKEEIIVYSAHIRRELRNPAIHGLYNVKVVWGQKPEV